MKRGKRPSKLLRELQVNCKLCETCQTRLQQDPNFKVPDLCPVCREHYRLLCVKRASKRSAQREQAEHAREVLAYKRKMGTVKVRKGKRTKEEPFAKPLNLVGSVETRLIVIRQTIKAYESMLDELRKEEAVLAALAEE